jgi:hypothetical protein
MRTIDDEAESWGLLPPDEQIARLQKADWAIEVHEDTHIIVEFSAGA